MRYKKAPKHTGYSKSCIASRDQGISTMEKATSSSILSIELQASSHVAMGQNQHTLKRVLTYGTFDLLHYGHIRLLRQAAALGDYLIVGLSTDEFNAEKGKQSFYSWGRRREMLEAIRYVDLVIPEYSWNQKRSDIATYAVDIVCMGSDWANDPHFESLRDICEVRYLERTEGISTTEVKRSLGKQEPATIER